MEFEKRVTLFLDIEELTTKVKEFLIERGIFFREEDMSEDVLSIYLTGRYIRISDLLGLEDVLDKRLTICSRYIGSAETIRSLGLD